MESGQVVSSVELTITSGAHWRRQLYFREKEERQFMVKPLKGKKLMKVKREKNRVQLYSQKVH